MNEYMRKKRANGIHKKVPKYIRTNQGKYRHEF